MRGYFRRTVGRVTVECTRGDARYGKSWGVGYAPRHRARPAVLHIDLGVPAVNIHFGFWESRFAA